MSKQSELSSYIASLQQRLRLGAWLRGAAIFTGTALLVTLALVLVLNHFAFPHRGVTFARLAIIASLAAAGVAVSEHEGADALAPNIPAKKRRRISKSPAGSAFPSAMFVDSTVSIVLPNVR